MKICRFFLFSLLLCSLRWTISCRPTPAPSGKPETKLSGLSLESSDTALNRAFEWAKEQALACAHPEGDPVGPWVEAALPGREAFCMRDLAHQSTGIWLLGLQPCNLNMLKKFAAAISPERDWCSYWEINRHDQPAPADYRDDKHFWYNLPANFDLLDACYRMFLWSGDSSLVRDSVFLDFYRHSLSDYVDRWQLDVTDYAARPRFLNRDHFDLDDPFQACRGIPSYHEGDPGKTRVGIDLLAFQARALEDMAEMAEIRGKHGEAEMHLEKSAAVVREMIRLFHVPADNGYRDLLLTDGSTVYGGNMQMYVLHNRIGLPPGQEEEIVARLLQAGQPNIEILSHYPDILFRYGQYEAAFRILLTLVRPETLRRTYPEVPFSVVSSVVTGLMGIEAGQTGITTLPAFPAGLEWVELRDIPFRNGSFRLRQEGNERTTLTNTGPQPLAWKACFPGSGDYLYVNGEKSRAEKGTAPGGRACLWLQLELKPGASASVGKFKP